MITTANLTKTTTTCYHCGASCRNEQIAIAEKVFCCNGCKMVFQILNEKELCDYYDFNAHPGVLQTTVIRQDKFAFLDNPEIVNKLIQFKNGKQTQITLYLPQIHCSSCLWLLENLHKLDAGIQNAKVNFTQKEIFIAFNNEDTTLRKIVETLTSIGYEPHLNASDVDHLSHSRLDRTRWYKLGVAGFCFGNIMMMSFADYFAASHVLEPKIKLFFSIASLLLSIPVLLYAASEFFVSAYNSLQHKYLNIDLPVALALVITFLRSIYEITIGNGNGYLDSMSGIVFFMLIGRWLQSRTYQSISFDRDFRSFFPIAISVIKDGKIIPTEIEHVKTNDVIQIHANEILPVDAILSKGNANIDYSFVNGESDVNQIKIGEIIYAGGKQLGGLIELIVTKEVSQSYLTNLWNNPVFHQDEKIVHSAYDAIGKYFTYFVLAAGLAAGGYWYMHGSIGLMWNAITTVLIVACPCALLLASNYTNGNLLRIFGKNKFYLRSADVLEKFTQIQHIVLDKTGTLTQSNSSKVRYYGLILSTEVKQYIASLLYQSAHPLSKAVLDFLNVDSIINITDCKEIEGKGIEGWINDTHFKIGSAAFVGGELQANQKGTKVIVKIDSNIVGEFLVTNNYRFGIPSLMDSLKKNYSLSLLSGDNDSEAEKIEQLLGVDSEIYFNQTPEQKLKYIYQLQHQHQKNVMMVGDGLNDAGALKQSNIGIAVADGGNSFTPSCDGVIDGTSLNKLNKFLNFAKAGKKIILFTFIFSAIYNAIGLYYAVQGILSPVIAAILMPCSSITIILLSYGLVQIMARKYFPKHILTNNIYETDYA